MSEENAGGRKPQMSRSESLLEDQMEQLVGAVADCFATARKIDPAMDEYGHARHAAYHDAVSLLKASARLGRVLGTLRGGKFVHDINVTRQVAEGSGKPRRRRRVTRHVQQYQGDTLPTPPADPEGSNDR